MIFIQVTQIIEWIASMAYTVFDFTFGALTPPDGIAIQYIKMCIVTSIVLCIFCNEYTFNRLLPYGISLGTYPFEYG